MCRRVLIFCAYLSFTQTAIFIERSSLDFDENIGNMSTTFYHNERQNSITNLTIVMYKPITKVLIYVTLRFAENENDRDYKREFLRTVFDVEKWYKGAQINFLIKAFMENLRRFMDFEIKLPFKPVDHMLLLLLLL